MTLNNLVPWKKGRRSLALGGEEPSHPFYALQRQMNRLFEDFFGDFPLQPWRGGADLDSGFMPRVDVAETDKDIAVTAELPGLEQKDIEVRIADGLLTLTGEKKQSSEEKKDGLYHAECSYGTFSRSIALPAEVDEEKADASFKNGVLRIRLPKAEPEQAKARRIEVKTG